MSDDFESAVEGGGQEPTESQMKQILGQRLWATWQNQRSKFFQSLERHEWDKARGVLERMVTAWTGQATSDEIIYLLGIIEVFSGRYYIQETFTESDMDESGQLPSPLNKPLTYDNFVFQEAFFKQMALQIHAHITGLFDPYIRGGFTAAATEAAADDDELEIKAMPQVPLAVTKDQRHAAVSIAHIFTRISED